MILCDELYFEISLSGAKSEIKKFVSFLKSGELDEFFEIDADYIDFGDDYTNISDDAECEITFANDDMGIEIDEFDSDEFLEVFCRAGKNLDIKGRFYDADDEEYNFVSHKGDSYYLNALKMGLFNDELDEHAYKEELEEEDEEE